MMDGTVKMKDGKMMKMKNGQMMGMNGMMHSKMKMSKSHMMKDTASKM